MKSSNSVNKTVLTKSQIKRGISVSRKIAKEVPVRKVKRDILKEVQFTRNPAMVTEYGKPIAVILPVCES